MEQALERVEQALERVEQALERVEQALERVEQVLEQVEQALEQVESPWVVVMPHLHDQISCLDVTAGHVLFSFFYGVEQVEAEAG